MSVIFYWLRGLLTAHSHEEQGARGTVFGEPYTFVELHARLCGKVFSVEITGERFTVSLDGVSISATVGETITI